ncbi:hypothetical protein AJ78_08303 [Emergomyces pasteurianus Ep9510]|uniref:Uncharacterized protein n=1 Tax=Emergomyces pasteurianus Ep9510 TaxID=1447872 RepID=A0A1J9Q6I7_9EURO|nr:hypothetical protein AJ78_08303 [Emergomyces pasteurianus Ep9510]
MTPRPALVPEQLGDGTSITLPASEEHPGLMELNQETDGTQNHEWSHSSPDASIMIEAEMRTENISAAPRSSSSTCSPERITLSIQSRVHAAYGRGSGFIHFSLPSGRRGNTQRERKQKACAGESTTKDLIKIEMKGSEKELTSDPTDNLNDNYTASSLDSSDLMKRQSKRRKFSSRSAATMAHRPRPRPQMAVTDRSVSSTSSQPVASTGGFQFEHALNPRLLSPENISTLISAFAQKLLDLRRDSSTDTWRTMVQTENVSVGEDRRTVEPDRKRSRWTREEDDRLKDLKTRGWR